MTSGLEKTKDVNSLMITENKSTVQVFIFIYDLGKKNKPSYKMRTRRELSYSEAKLLWNITINIKNLQSIYNIILISGI